MKPSTHILILVIFPILLSGGCVKFSPFGIGSTGHLSDDSADYLLSCLKDMPAMEKENFSAKFNMAEKRLQNGTDHDRLDFICLSFNAEADDLQRRQGIEVLQSYIDDHHASGNILGLKVLTERLNEAMVDKDKALQSLAMEKKRLTAEVQSLQKKLQEHETLVGKLQQQIEEIKNIEKIIKSREAEQP